jgi:small subunit ribosomal protein S16e
VNGCPLDIIKPDILRLKLVEVINVLGLERLSRFDLKIITHGGGQVSQIYAIRQALARAVLAFYAKFADVESRLELKEIILALDRTLLVSDPRRCEPKKAGGRAARARFQKSYR